MRKLRAWIMRLGGLFNQRRQDRELEAEIASHLEMHVADNLRLGMTPDEARRQALIKLGGAESTKEAYRYQRGLPWLETLLQDIRHGARVLVKNPGFTAVAVLTLALGIGANTAIFSVVHAVLLKPLPFPHPERIVIVHLKGGPGTLSRGDFADIVEHSTVFSQVTAFDTVNFNLSAGGSSRRVTAGRVSHGFLATLGIEPQLGRGFLPEDDQPGGGKIALIGQRLWEEHFGGDRNVIGRELRLDAESHVVVGVMPATLDFPNQADLWVPAALGASGLRDYTGYFLKLAARLKPDITPAAALAELAALGQRAGPAYPEYRKNWRWALTPLHDHLVGTSLRATLLVLLSAVGLVLCIACTNVANLLLNLAAGRQKEISIRAALGATRRRLLLQFLTESMLLAGLGGVAGLVLAHVSINALTASLPATWFRYSPLTINSTVLWFTAGISLLPGLLFGLAPAFQTRGRELAGSLSASGRGTTAGLTLHRFQSSLIVVEVALTFILLVGAGVLMKSLYFLSQVPLGFRPEQVLTARIDLTALRYPTAPQRVNFQQELLARVQSLPGVQTAGIISVLPFSDARAFGNFSLEGEAPAGQMLMAGLRAIGGDYFGALRISLVQGRGFDARDQAQSLPVVMVNKTMADKCWPGTSPLGKRVKTGAGPWREIVGVAGDIRHDSMEQEPRPEMFFPFAQNPGTRINLVVKTGADPILVASSLRAAVAALDPGEALFGVQPMRQRLSDSLVEPRLRVVLLGIFAGLALLLSLTGIYGVISYSVARRTKEIGIRMALGAQRRDVLGMILGNGFQLALLGLLLGTGGAMVMTRFLASFLYQVKPMDGLTCATVLLLIVITVLLACFFPARRATKVHPVIALRCE